MLQRPRRPLPRQFRRRVSPQTRTFVRRRHARVKKRKTERLKRNLRRITAVTRGWALFLRRWALLSVLVLFVALIGVGLFSPLFQIKNIEIERTQARVDKRQAVLALKELYGRHLLFITTHEVTERLQGVIPDLDSAIVSKRYPYSLAVRVTLKPVVARLSIEGARVDAAAGSSSSAAATSGAGFFDPALALQEVKQYDYLTANGVYVSLPSVQSGTLITLRIVDWAARPVPNTRLLSPEFLERLKDTETALEEQFGQQTRDRTVYVRGQEYHLTIANNVALWFDLRSPLAEQLDRYKIFLRTIGLPQATRYVDLRLNGRVVYR